jgi:hypothetical protein
VDAPAVGEDLSRRMDAAFLVDGGRPLALKK